MQVRKLFRSYPAPSELKSGRWYTKGTFGKTNSKKSGRDEAYAIFKVLRILM